MSRTDPGRVLRLALVGWGLGHVAVGQAGLGRGLLLAEAVWLFLIAWLTAGLASSSAYLLPYLAGCGFIAAWAWQAVDAYRRALRLQGAIPPTPARSPAAAIGWLSLPLLAWGTGFWLVGAQAATPAAALDTFVTAWSADRLTAEWPSPVVAAADRAARSLTDGADRLRNVRLRVTSRSADRATAVAEAVHYQRRESRLLGVFSGTQLVPVADRRVLTVELAAEPVELPGGGDIGAVRWRVVGARTP